MKGRRLVNNTILLLLAIRSANKEEGKQRLLIFPLNQIAVLWTSECLGSCAIYIIG